MIEIATPGAGEEPVAMGAPPRVPARLPVLPLRDTVTFPDTLTPLAVGQERSVRLVNDVLGGDRMLAMVASRDPELESPGPEQLYEVGVLGTVARMLKVPDGTLRILVQAGPRVRLTGWDQQQPYLVADVEEAPDVLHEGPELTALMRNVQQTFSRIIEDVPYLPEELQLAVANLEDPSALAHLIGGALRIKAEEKQELLEERDVARRLRRLSELLARELEVARIGSRIQSQVQSELDRTQREYVLRQQLKAIQEELGERDPAEAEVEELREQLAQIALPEDVARQAERELARLEKLPQAAAEHGVIRTYLEWIASLPWDRLTEDNLDLGHAREVLDADHYDIERVKDRILEFLAVRKLKPDARGSILCFVGPPGVGKTSLGHSIARALGRKFERISAGGVRDEAEIRGHRRTYIGAMPGTIIRALRDAGSANPLFMIDEIDKMGADYRGGSGERDARGARPGAERDLPRPLPRRAVRPLARDVHHDREHARHGPGAAARPHGGDRARRLHRGGEAADRPAVPRAAADRAQRPQALADRVLRHRPEGDHRALHPRGGRAQPRARDRLRLPQGRPQRGRGPARAQGHGHRAARARAARPARASCPRRAGARACPAWPPAWPGRRWAATSCSSRRPRCPGKGRLTVTGQLGDVMKESAQAALSWVRGHARDLGDDWFADHDLHVHVPAGAVPKDGPSAGVTMATALMSLVTGRPVRDDTAMTGEITLTGQVLPIGGLKEKALAAQRAGITRVIAPRRNEPDLEDLPEHLRGDIEFVWAAEVEDVLEAALEPAAGRAGAAPPPAARRRIASAVRAQPPVPAAAGPPARLPAADAPARRPLLRRAPERAAVGGRRRLHHRHPAVRRPDVPVALAGALRAAAAPAAARRRHREPVPPARVGLAARPGARPRRRPRDLEGPRLPAAADAARARVGDRGDLPRPALRSAS